PAFYGNWFMERLEQGYACWKRPFSGRPQYVSFAKARAIVFWSKNPAPFFHHLDTLDRLGMNYYFLFTLNDYDAEGLEPCVPPLDERIATFIRLSDRVGKGRVVWRSDPLLLSDSIPVDALLGKLARVGDRIHPYTDRLIFSFIDIAKYPKVQRSLREQGFSGVREFTGEEIILFSEGLADLNKRWGLTLATCADRRDLSAYGIGKGQCISYDLLMREFSDDRALAAFLAGGGQTAIDGTGSAARIRELKDPGQRGPCGCIVSKDTGQYNTCPHLCAYCYANSSVNGVQRNYSRYRESERTGSYPDTIVG
ncbi:DUF1848 domain-containing protein, partial [Methanoregula sp.]|uniref:DUF1848 domain-containing protein n=1 Tax=Methanoregula sp. TaxID=2052170 RepID=UPI000CAA0A78